MAANLKPNGRADLLEPATRERIDAWVAKFPEDRKRSALIQALVVTQDQNGGWLSRELIEATADYLGLPAVWAHEVASFYSMLFLEPVGRHKVHVCTNISCWLNGAEDLLAHIEKRLETKVGGTTADGRITLVREEECLAACCGAPMMVVDGHYHENLDAGKADAILDALD